MALEIQFFSLQIKMEIPNCRFISYRLLLLFLDYCSKVNSFCNVNHNIALGLSCRHKAGLKRQVMYRFSTQFDLQEVNLEII